MNSPRALTPEDLQLEHGFTLTEALVVIVIIGTMVVIATPALLQMYQSYTVKSAATQLATHIRFARNLCVSQKVDYRVVIKNTGASSDKNTYLIEYDPDGSGFVSVPDVDFTLPKGIEILDSAVFSGGVATIQFNTRGGAKAIVGSPPYEISLRSPNNLILRVRIQLTGEVEVEKV